MKNIIKKAIIMRLIIAIIIMTAIPAGTAKAAWSDDIGSWLKNALAPTVLAEKTNGAMERGLATVQGVALMSVNKPTMDVINTLETFVTAYSSSVDETDETPFITASGEKVRDGIVAANFLPFGTRVRIPEMFGDKIFVVKDRMAAKHNGKVDIWFETKGLAKQFGRQKLMVEVLDPAYFQ